MTGPKSFAAPWPTRGRRRGGFSFASPEDTEDPDDFEEVCSTEGYQDEPSVRAERAELERLLARRDTLIEQVRAIGGACRESTKLRRQIAALEGALREAGVEGF